MLLLYHLFIIFTIVWRYFLKFAWNSSHWIKFWWAFLFYTPVKTTLISPYSERKWKIRHSTKWHLFLHMLRKLKN